VKDANGHLSLVLYTAVGGLKAAFLTDFLHTAVALTLIVYFMLSMVTSEAVGGVEGLGEKVMATAPENYITNNYQGSLLTIKFRDAIIWSLILKFGNLALVVIVR
jgi:Na+/proline symporter